MREHATFRPNQFERWWIKKAATQKAIIRFECVCVCARFNWNYFAFSKIIRSDVDKQVYVLFPLIIRVKCSSLDVLLLLLVWLPYTLCSYGFVFHFFISLKWFFITLSQKIEFVFLSFYTLSEVICLCFSFGYSFAAHHSFKFSRSLLLLLLLFCIH